MKFSTSIILFTVLSCIYPFAEALADDDIAEEGWFEKAIIMGDDPDYPPEEFGAFLICVTMHIPDVWNDSAQDHCEVGVICWWKWPVVLGGPSEDIVLGGSGEDIVIGCDTVYECDRRAWGN